MRPQPSPPIPPPSTRSLTETTGPPGLWHRLDPARRQQLAQCLAQLIRQMRRAARPPAEEADDHEPA
jgi:hypothetical protein